MSLQFPKSPSINFFFFPFQFSGYRLQDSYYLFSWKWVFKFIFHLLVLLNHANLIVIHPPIAKPTYSRSMPLDAVDEFICLRSIPTLVI